MSLRSLSGQGSTSLDILRAVSSQLVVIGHGISFCGIALSLHQPNFPWMQNIAVVVFFILSGFLISYSLSRKRNNNCYLFSHYIVDRFVRIYAAFIPALLFVAFIDFVSINKSGGLYQYSDAYNVKTFLGNVFMLQDFPKLNIVTSFGSARPFWTLAIEWWIYLFVGSFFFFAFRDQDKKYLVFALVFLTVPLYNLLGGRGNGLFLYWIFGVAIFLIWNSALLSDMSINKKLLGLAVFTILAAYRVIDTKVEYDKIFAIYLSFSILFLVEVSSQINFPKMFFSLSKFFAGYSYTLYLIHYSIYDFLVTHYGDGYLVFFIGLLLSNILAFAIGFCFEGRGTKYIKRKMYLFIDTKTVQAKKYDVDSLLK